MVGIEGARVGERKGAEIQKAEYHRKMRGVKEMGESQENGLT